MATVFPLVLSGNKGSPLSINYVIACKTGLAISDPPLSRSIKVDWNHRQHNIYDLSTTCCILKCNPKNIWDSTVFFSPIPLAALRAHVHLCSSYKLYKGGKVQECMMPNIITTTLMIYV